MQNLKQCCKCKEYKPTMPEYFHREKSRRDGLNPRCKVCVKAFQQSIHPKMIEAAYRWRDANPEKAKAALKNWREANPEKKAAQEKKWRQQNREKIAAYPSRRDKDKARRLASLWDKNNPIAAAAKVQRRRARIRGNGGGYTAQEWDDLCKKYDYRCLDCGEKKPLTVDHVIPVSKGGLSTIDNIQILCRECNASKGTKIIDFRY